MALVENLAVFLNDFGIPCSKGATNFVGILDSPDEQLNMGQVNVLTTMYSLTYQTSAVSISSGDAIVAGGTNFTVRDVLAIDDGVFFQVDAVEMSTLSIREQILARMQSQLAAAAITGVGSNVFRSRDVSLTRGLSPAIVIIPIDDQAKPFSSDPNGKDDVEFIAAVEIFVRGDTWDTLADAIHVPAHAAIMADVKLTSAGSLGALTARVRRADARFESHEADRTAGTLTQHYRIRYLNSADDLTT